MCVCVWVCVCVWEGAGTYGPGPGVEVPGCVCVCVCVCGGVELLLRNILQDARREVLLDPCIHNKQEIRLH